MKPIDKDKVVAEIEKELNTTKKYSTEYVNGKKYALNKILSFLDTLEVIDVNEEPVSNDFEEEYDNYTKHILACDVQSKPFTHLYNCAKYFFELGLKAKSK